jgi:hypothetical protein
MQKVQLVSYTKGRAVYADIAEENVEEITNRRMVKTDKEEKHHYHSSNMIRVTKFWKNRSK